MNANWEELKEQTVQLEFPYIDHRGNVYPPDIYVPKSLPDRAYQKARVKEYTAPVTPRAKTSEESGVILSSDGTIGHKIPKKEVKPVQTVYPIPEDSPKKPVERESLILDHSPKASHETIQVNNASIQGKKITQEEAPKQAIRRGRKPSTDK